MAVKRCPTCGDLYLAAVAVCADCGTTLGEVESAPDEPDEPDAGAPATEGDHTIWPLEAWTMEGRRLLDGMLTSAEIPHSWQGATLVAPSVAIEQIQEMVDTVGAADARVGVAGSELAALDADADEPVGYQVSDWSDEALDRLAARLEEQGIPHGWDDDGDLVVAAEHEAAVDAIFDELAAESGEGSEDEADGGPDALDVLSELFLAVDRLARNALDGAAARGVHEAADRLDGLRLPYGFAPAVWSSIVERAGALSAHLDDDEVEDDDLETEAASLRDLLRDYV
jgi:hypothetical protein